MFRGFLCALTLFVATAGAAWPQAVELLEVELDGELVAVETEDGPLTIGFEPTGGARAARLVFGRADGQDLFEIDVHPHLGLARVTRVEDAS